MNAPLPADQCYCPRSSYGVKHTSECYEAQIKRLSAEVASLREANEHANAQADDYEDRIIAAREALGEIRGS